MTELWLVRHTAVDVPQGVCYGQTDVPLRESFPSEAEKVAAQLAGERFDEVWTSPLSRCTQLADFCGYGEVAKRDSRLLEIDFGEWEMKHFDEIEDPQLQRWYNDWLKIRPTGGESFDDQYTRVASFLDELRERRCRRALIFAHGGVLLAAGIYAGIYTFENAFGHLTPHGGLLRLELA